MTVNSYYALFEVSKTIVNKGEKEIQMIIKSIVLKEN